LALDEPNDNDRTYDISGLKYVVDKELMEPAKPIKIDFMGRGFTITSSLVLEKLQKPGLPVKLMIQEWAAKHMKAVTIMVKTYYKFHS